MLRLLLSGLELGLKWIVSKIRSSGTVLNKASIGISSYTDFISETNMQKGCFIIIPVASVGSSLPAYSFSAEGAASYFCFVSYLWALFLGKCPHTYYVSSENHLETSHRVVFI